MIYDEKRCRRDRVKLGSQDFKLLRASAVTQSRGQFDGRNLQVRSNSRLLVTVSCSLFFYICCFSFSCVYQAGLRHVGCELSNVQQKAIASMAFSKSTPYCLMDAGVLGDHQPRIWNRNGLPTEAASSTQFGRSAAKKVYPTNQSTHLRGSIICSCSSRGRVHLGLAFYHEFNKPLQPSTSCRLLCTSTLFTTAFSTT